MRIQSTQIKSWGQCLAQWKPLINVSYVSWTVTPVGRRHLFVRLARVPMHTIFKKFLYYLKNGCLVYVRSRAIAPLRTHPVLDAFSSGSWSCQLFPVAGPPPGVTAFLLWKHSWQHGFLSSHRRWTSSLGASMGQVLLRVCVYLPSSFPVQQQSWQ